MISVKVTLPMLGSRSYCLREVLEVESETIHTMLNHCARQNVILELGYFLAKLGRSRVCALYEKGVEIPSDYQGVLFIEIDERGRWKFDLAQEMKAAGLQIDLNEVR